MREDNNPGCESRGPAYRSLRTLMRRIVLAFVRSFVSSLVGRSVGLMLEALSLEARTRGKDRRRKLSLRLRLSPSYFSISFSLPFSLSVLLSPSRPPSSSLLSGRHGSLSCPLAPLITLPFYNAPLCSATAEPCIFLDAMDFPKAFRCYARASPLSRRGPVKLSGR